MKARSQRIEKQMQESALGHEGKVEQGEGRKSKAGQTRIARRQAS